MRTYLDCIPCFLRQALEAARLVSDDADLHQQVLRSVLTSVARMDLHQAPPAMARQIHQIIREACRDEDPYRAVKASSNQLILELLPQLRQRVTRSDDPLQTALRLAIAGNVIDYGVQADLGPEQVHRSIEWSLTAPLDTEIFEALRGEIARAESILYLADNAGEIVCDRLLVEQLPLERVLLVVKGSPVINDATRADAAAAGLTQLVRVMDNGSDVPGTILSLCSATFRRAFDVTDLVIAKGQGNYETLNDADRRVYLLFKAKCPVIAQDVGGAVGDLVVSRSH